MIDEVHTMRSHGTALLTTSCRSLARVCTRPIMDGTRHSVYAPIGVHVLSHKDHYADLSSVAFWRLTRVLKCRILLRTKISSRILLISTDLHGLFIPMRTENSSRIWVEPCFGCFAGIPHPGLYPRRQFYSIQSSI